MIEKQKYDDGFFDDMEETSYESAKIILPLIYEAFPFKSVVDIGCGTGVWLKVCAEEIGIDDYCGIEGPYIKAEKIKVPVDRIKFADLKQELSLPKKYDLAISLEVAEHLPESSADNFVQSLIGASDVILFSAAIPGQEGTYHINEQFPEYWAKKFDSKGFVPVDMLRKKIWDNSKVGFWYSQNILLFIRKEKLHEYPTFALNASYTDGQFLTRIHPVLLSLKTEHIKKISHFFGLLEYKWYLLKTKYFKKHER